MKYIIHVYGCWKLVFRDAQFSLKKEKHATNYFHSVLMEGGGNSGLFMLLFLLSNFDDNFCRALTFLPSFAHSNIGERVQDFLLAMLQGGSAKKCPELHFPLGLVSPELAELGTAFGRIVHFNRTVFGPFYAPILRKLLLPSGEIETGDDSRWDGAEPKNP